MFNSKTSSSNSGRNIFGSLLADIEAFQLEQILRALDGILQRPVGIVQRRRHVQRLLPLGFRLSHETIGMQFAAQPVKARLQIVEREIQTPRKTEDLVKVAHAEKDVPQPQLFFAFGLSNSKPE